MLSVPGPGHISSMGAECAGVWFSSSSSQDMSSWDWRYSYLCVCVFHCVLLCMCECVSACVFSCISCGVVCACVCLVSPSHPLILPPGVGPPILGSPSRARLGQGHKATVPGGCLLFWPASVLALSVLSNAASDSAPSAKFQASGG